MNRSKFILLLAMAILSLGAGLVLGWAWTPLQRPQVDPAASHAGSARPWFDQLGLSPQQQKQMDAIWSDTGAQMHKLFEHRMEIDRQRDAQVLALLTPVQREAFEKINQRYRSQREEDNQRRDALLASANARSRAILDPAQQEKWDILSRQMRHHRPMNDSAMNGASTRSASTRPWGEGESKP